MSGPFSGAGSNPPVGGSGAVNPTANPLAGGQQGNQPPQSGNNGVPGSNPPVGGSNNANQQQQPNQQPDQQETDNSPVARDVYNERVRAERVLKQRVEQLETLQRQREEAQMSEAERMQRRLAEYEQKEATWQQERQNFYMDKAIGDVATEKSLASASAVRAIMLAEFAHLIGYDDDTGRPNNIGYVVDQVVAKYPFLVQQQPQQVPGSGRPFSPPRPGGQPAGQQQQNMAQPQFVPPQEWKKLSDLAPDDWARGNSRNNNNNPNNNR